MKVNNGAPTRAKKSKQVSSAWDMGEKAPKAKAPKAPKAEKAPPKAPRAEPEKAPKQQRRGLMDGTVPAKGRLTGEISGGMGVLYVLMELKDRWIITKSEPVEAAEAKRKVAQLAQAPADIFWVPLSASNFIAELPDWAASVYSENKGFEVPKGDSRVIRAALAGIQLWLRSRPIRNIHESAEVDKALEVLRATA